MTFAVKDRIGETSTTTGTGTLTLAGAQTGFQALSSIGANNSCTYFLTDGTNWEVGIGTYLATPSRLQRDTVLASSNSGSAVNWGGTTINVYVGIPADGIKATRRKSKSVAGSANVTLTQDEMRCDVLELTGVLTGNIDVIVDASVWTWPVVYNNTTGAFTVTFKVTGLTGVKVPQKRALALHNNGTDVIRPGDGAATDSRSSNTILSTGDFGKNIIATSSFTQTIDAVATLGDGWWCHYKNDGTGTITLDGNASETINGVTTLAIPPGHGGRLRCNGAALYMDVSPSMDKGQVKFPATQNASSDANTLDDYEEGTWSPSVGGTATYSVQIGRYVKIGKYVWLSGRMAITNLGTGSNTTINNAPFAAANLGSDQAGSISKAASLAVNVIFVSAYIVDNSANINFSSSAAAATSLTLGSGILGSGADITFSIFYESAG